MRARRDAHRPRRADVVVDRAQLQIVVEHLDAAVAAIGDVDVALRVDLKRVRHVELAGPGCRACRPDLMKRPFLSYFTTRELHVAVGDEDVALRIPATSVGRPNVYCCAVAAAFGRRGRDSSLRRPPAGGRAPSARLPFGLNLMTMLVPSSTAQMLSSLSTRTACANAKPYSPCPISVTKVPF